MASDNEIYTSNFDFFVIARLMYLIALHFLLDFLNRYPKHSILIIFPPKRTLPDAPPSPFVTSFPHTKLLTHSAHP